MTESAISTRRKLLPYAVAIPTLAVLSVFLWPPLLTRAIDTKFLPHKFCYLADGPLIYFHVVSDLVIGTAYVAISATLAYLVHRARRDIPFSWMFLAFGLFIVACGGTHFMEVVTTIGPPVYWLSADLKVITAVASVATAALLPGLVPNIVDMLTIARLRQEQAGELRAANVRLRELERMSAEVVSRASIGLAMWEWNPATDVVNWTGDVEQVFGVPADKLRNGGDVFALMHPADARRVQQELQRSTVEQRDFDSEFRIETNGQTRWIVARARVTAPVDGEPSTVIGVNMDVTARKRAEDAMRQSDKLAVAGRMAASIAHEINNPLEAVTNLIYLIRAAAPQGPVLEYANMADAELSRVAHIVRQTLGFYREASQPVQVSIAALLEDVLRLLAPRLRQKEIVVDQRFRDSGTIWALPGEIRQVLANLVTNAIDAMGPGGRLQVRISSFSSLGEPRAMITIADNGTGIPAHDRARVFEPFFTTKGEKGNGLGLWVSQNIVEKHRGKLRMKTSTRPERRGTVFAIFLPCDRRTAPRK